MIKITNTISRCNECVHFTNLSNIDCKIYFCKRSMNCLSEIIKIGITLIELSIDIPEDCPLKDYKE